MQSSGSKNITLGGYEINPSVGFGSIRKIDTDLIPRIGLVFQSEEGNSYFSWDFAGEKNSELQLVLPSKSNEPVLAGKIQYSTEKSENSIQTNLNLAEFRNDLKSNFHILLSQEYFEEKHSLRY